MNTSAKQLNPLKGQTRSGTFLAVYLCLTGLLIPAILYLSHNTLYQIFEGPFSNTGTADQQVLLFIIFAVYFMLMSIMNVRRLHDSGYSGFIAYFVCGTSFIETVILRSGYTLCFFAGFSLCLVFMPHCEDLSRHTDVFK